MAGRQPNNPTQPGGRQPGLSPTTVQVSGTALTSLKETEIVTGGKTIILTIISDTWVADGGTFDAVRQDILDGITAAASPVTGWNNLVRDVEAVTAVVRTSDNIVTITLSPAPGYSIDAGETITVTVPASAMLGTATEVVASPTFVTARVSGSPNVSARKPTTRKISARSLVYAIDGPEASYPVYQFSNRIFIERKGHNPFD